MRKEVKQKPKTGSDSVSQGSSSAPDSQSIPNHKKQKRNEQWNGVKTAFKTYKFAVDLPCAVDIKDYSNPSDKTLTGISCTVSTGGIQTYEKNNETEDEEILNTQEMQVNDMATRDSTANQVNSLCKEWNKKERYREESSTDEKEALEEEALRSITSVKESLLEGVDSVKESEADEEKAGEEEEEDRKTEDKDEKSKASGRRSKEDDNKDDYAGNYSEVLASESEKNIQDR